MDQDTETEARGWIGTTLGGRYQVLDLLGTGGMGTVFRARDRELDEVIAVKLLRRDLLSVPGIVERFRREVKLARRVTHRNVARVFDIGEHGSDKFLTMELVEGRPLSERLRAAPLLWQDAVRISIAIAEGLTAAHAAGVVHRDLKPENVLLAKDGRVVITDFGVARAHLEGDVLRTAGSAVGTPAYMAPEQIEAEQEVDARADIYAFGAVMFELFTGRRAWLGEAPIAVAAARLLQPPPDPLTVRPDLPDPIAEIIRRCMARRPADRFSTAEAVGVALRIPSPWAIDIGDRSSSVEYDARTAPTIMDMPDPGPSDPAPDPFMPGLARIDVPALSAPAASSAKVIAATSAPRSPPVAQPTLASPTPAGGVAAGPQSTPISVAPPPPLDSGAAPSNPTSAPPSSPKTIAVLPFRNAGGPDDEYLADGLTDELIDTLSMTPGLRVRSRGVVMQHKGVDADPREIGARLDVGLVVEGSIRRTPAGVRITARVVSVADGLQLWAKRFDKSNVDVFDVSEEVARAVAEALTLDGAAPAREAPADPVAVDLYLRARQEYRKYWPENVKRSVALFEDALALAPSNPSILSAYALACARMWWFGGSEGQRAEAKARDAAERALAAAPHLGDPHVAMAQIYWNAGDGAGAARETMKALARAPTLAEAHALRGRILVEANRLDAGIKSLTTAMTLDPHVPLGANDLTRAYALQGRTDEMFQATEQLLKTEGPLSLWFLRTRVAMWQRDKQAAARYLGELDRGERAFAVVKWMLEQILAIDPPSEAIDLSFFVAREESSVRRRSFMFQVETEVRCYHQQYNAALRSMEKSVEAGLFDAAWAAACPLLAPLRGHERFIAARAIVEERARAALEELG